MKIRLAMLMLTAPLIALTATMSAAGSSGSNLASGADSWRTVVDGVMGGRSSGRISQTASGNLLFTGNLSLENNGGFSQVRTATSDSAFAGTEGIEIRVRGDGRAYNFDVRASNARMMAGAFQQEFQTLEGQWLTIKIPFDQFRLYSFGRRVANAVSLDPAMIESVGVTLSDKVEGDFRLEISTIQSYRNNGAASLSDGNDLASVAGRSGLGTLLQLIEAADLQLPEGVQLAILAPTDAAFAKIPSATLEHILQPENRETLRAVLNYHILTPSLTSTDLFSRRNIETLNGQRLKIDDAGALPTINGSGLIAVNVRFDGGIVHVIDEVLMPQLSSIAEIGPESDQLSTLTTAVIAAGLGDQLSAEKGPWTIFAPVDSAFSDLPDGALDGLLRTENRVRLTDLLGLHIVPGRLYSSDLLATKSVQTLFGETVEFAIKDGRLCVGDASLIGEEIEASNGVIHLIDSVILPSEPEPRSVELNIEAARLCELAISRGAPLFNAGQTGACASIYEIAIETMLVLGADKLDRNTVQRLELGIAEAKAQRSATDRAWTYRRTLDDVYGRLTQSAAWARAATAH